MTRLVAALFAILFATGVLTFTAHAQTIDVPIVDVPYNAAHGFRAPSMQQSLGLTSSFYDASHVALQDAFGENHKALGKTTIALVDFLTLTETPLPLGDAWLHEEWHRAVMGSRGIDSHNDVYNFQFGTDAISVSHVRDEDLVRLKREHPADLVRLDEAGVEGEYALTQRLEKERFFDDSRAWHLPLYWIVKLGAAGYVGTSTDDDVNDETDKMNREDGADVAKRDFTGWDFTGWMYDLSRPDEPYEARGVHPSGVGINRYRAPRDLTPEERSFLRRVGRLQAINFLDTNLVGIDGFRAGGMRWNVTGSHLLTSFGYTTDANVFLRNDAHKLFVVVHRYTNHERNFPGAEAELVDEKVRMFGRELTMTPRVAIWSQPANQRFRDSDGKLGGVASLRVELPQRDRFGMYVEVEAKSAGWSAGTEALGSSVAMRLGVTRGL